MNTYKITFLTFDGNQQQVFVEAKNEQRAERSFMQQYEFSEILKIEFAQ